MIKQLLLAVSLLLAFTATGTAAQQVVTGQVLDYESGYFFFTTGDGFRVSPQAAIVNGPPHVRDYARVTFDDTGTIVRIEISHAKLPTEGDLASLHRFAVALSPEQPNPDLAKPPAAGRCGRVQGGKLVGVRVTVQVPPNTPLTDSVYMTSDQSGWNPQAYPLDRIDTLHYRTLLQLYSGTVMHVLIDRGSLQTEQVGENGIEIQPLLLCIGNEDAQAFNVHVYRWADDQAPGQGVPQAFPTPYNPAPFPNLPPAPRPTLRPLIR